MYQLQTFGPVELRTADGQSVRSVLAQPRRTALLLYLAVATPRGFHRRDSLLALLWPEFEGERGRAALSQAVYFLRRSLGDSVLLSRGSEELAVDPLQLYCDVVRFVEALRDERKEEALALYRADFLEGFHISGAPEFERWVDRERQRLREKAVRAAWDLARQAEEKRDLAGALDWGNRAVAVAGEEEPEICRLLSLMARVGERSKALRRYDDWARGLREELGLDPAPETVALASSLRASSPAAAAVPLPAPELHESTESTPPSSPTAAGGSRRDASPAPRGRGRLSAVIAGAAGAVALASMLALALGESATLDPIRNRIVVGGLENRTGDSSLDVLGLMAADWITEGLQETGLVEVIDPVTAFVSTRKVTAEASDLPGVARAAALAQETGAGTVVWGSYYRTGDSLHFNVSISDVRSATRRQITVSGPAERQAALVVELRQRVAGALAGSLNGRIATLFGATSEPPRLDAYKEYAEGLELFARNEYMAAYPRLVKAAELDTSFILPRFWALFALGNVYDHTRRDSLLATLVPLRSRLSPLDRYSLDYFLAESRGDKVEALRAARHASRLAPRSNWTYMVGNLSLRLNRPRESLAALEQLDPESGWSRGWSSYWTARARAHHHLGQHSQELSDALRARSTDPADLERISVQIRALAARGDAGTVRALLDSALALPPPPAGSRRLSVGELVERAAIELRAHGDVAAANDLLRRDLDRLQRLPPTELGTKENRFRYAYHLTILGHFSEAEGQAEECLAEYPDDIGCAWLYGSLVAREGNRAEAERRSRQVRALAEREPHLVTWALVRRAVIAAQLGDSAEAVALIAESIRRGTGMIDWLHADPGLEPLWSYPPFQELIRPKG